MLPDTKSLSEVMCRLCEVISMPKSGIDTSKFAAMDIASGYHSYVFEINKYQKKVRVYQSIYLHLNKAILIIELLT